MDRIAELEQKLSAAEAELARQASAVLWLKEAVAFRDAALEEMRNACSEPIGDDPRMGYVEVQIGREDWDKLFRPAPSAAPKCTCDDTYYCGCDDREMAAKRSKPSAPAHCQCPGYYVSSFSPKICHLCGKPAAPGKCDGGQQ